MKCPVCEIELKLYVRQSIEIDYCPQCRGVWLDRGELDKIIEASLMDNSAAPRQQTTPPAPAAPMPPAASIPPRGPGYNAPRGVQNRPYDDDDDDYKRGHHRDYDRDYDRDRDYRSGNYKQRKKRGLLGDLFDVFD